MNRIWNSVAELWQLHHVLVPDLQQEEARYTLSTELSGDRASKVKKKVSSPYKPYRKRFTVSASSPPPNSSPFVPV
jgi:hypothetical protein